MVWALVTWFLLTYQELSICQKRFKEVDRCLVDHRSIHCDGALALLESLLKLFFLFSRLIDL